MTSQIGLEFMVGITILLLIYVVTMVVFSHYAQYSVVASEQSKQVCYTIASAIDSAAIGGDGFASKVTIPYKIDSKDFTIFVSNTSTVTVDWGKNIFACSVITQNITEVTFEPNLFSVINVNSTIHLGVIRTDKQVYNLNETVHINGSHYLGNVTLVIAYKNGSVLEGYPKNVAVVDNIFYYNWTPNLSGNYELNAVDTIYKNLNSRKDIEIV
jgi:hypothetical protein